MLVQSIGEASPVESQILVTPLSLQSWSYPVWSFPVSQVLLGVCVKVPLHVGSSKFADPGMLHGPDSRSVCFSPLQPNSILLARIECVVTWYPL